MQFKLLFVLENPDLKRFIVLQTLACPESVREHARLACGVSRMHFPQECPTFRSDPLRLTHFNLL
ncbi:hypothetical protein [Peribacillus muralis]|uniref:hypothetical protein n=1 Tax=Peribacillus muralis TaxID=264697 RepID=UPI00366DE65B